MAGIQAGNAGRLSIEIIAEVARLQQDMDKVRRLVKDASGDIAKSARHANDNIAGMGSGISKAGNQSKLAGHHMANLSFQLQDIIIGLQGGQKPMTVFLQQGSQIAQIAAQSGVGIGGMASAVGTMALNFAKAHPILVAVAAAAGLVAAALALVTDEINENSEVTVTWQDVVLGAFDVVAAAVSSTVTAAFEAMGIDIAKVWDFVVKATKMAMNLVIGATVAVPKIIAATYDKIGPAFGDAFYRAANIAIEALNWLVQKSAAPLNMLIEAMNGAFGTSIPKVVMGGLDKIANPYAGAMGRLAGAGAKAAVDAFSTDYIGGVADAISDAAQRRARLREAAEKGGKAVGSKAGKAMAEEAAKTYEQLLKEKLDKLGPSKILADIIKAGETPLEFKFVDPAEEIAKEERRRKDAEEDQRRRILDTAYDVADIIGGSIGRAMNSILQAAEQFRHLLESTNPILKALGGAGIGAAAAGATGGSGIGGAIGGALGGKLGEKFLSKGLESIMGGLGKFAGPLGAIAGGILGGVIGGLMTSTPRASATVSIIAGKAMETSITGNSAKLKKIAGGMADGLIAGLEKIAEQFGAELAGDAKISVGVRKGKYRVDPTGMGVTKTSKGAIDFGEDKAAAEAYATLLALRQLDLTGLSDSMKRLITASDDLSSNLEKASKFKSVFDELAQRDDPAKWAQEEVTRWNTSMAKIFAEAGATGEELAALERLTGIKRADAAKEAADKLAQIAREALEEQNRLGGMRATILELEGKTTEALNLRRQIELSTMTEAERALQQRIHTLEDEADATAKATAASEALTATRLSEYQTATSLINQLLELDGDVASLRARELAQLPESLRYLQELVWARQDEAKEVERLAAISKERDGLMTQWLQLIGDENTLRARALAVLDPSNRALQEQIWAYEDAQKAQQAAIDASKALIDQRNDEIAGINSTISALSQASEKWTQLAANIREFRAGLFAPQSGGLSYDQASTEFRNVSRMAALGNESSLQSFTGSAQSFLTAARENATSLVEYQRAIGIVAGASDAAVAGADSMAKQTVEQYAVLVQQRDQLEALNAQTQAQIETLSETAQVQANDVVPTLESLLNEAQGTRDDAMTAEQNRKAEAAAMVTRLANIEAILDRVTEGGTAVNMRSDETISVNVTNTVESPVNTLEVTP